MSLQTTPFAELTSERIVLRPPVMDDAEQLFTLRRDPRVNEHLGRKPPLSISEVQAFLQKIITDTRTGNSFYWAITTKLHSQLIGTICLWNFTDDRKKAEVGYELLPAFQRKGFMHEALALVLDFAFEPLQLQTVEGWTVASNIASIKTLEKHLFERDMDAEAQLQRLPDEPEFIIYSLPASRFKNLHRNHHEQ